MSQERELLAQAEQGDTNAKIELGVLYYGQGNLVKAVEWWEKAADIDANAARNLVFTYSNPDFPVHNREKFLKWLEVLAQKHKDPWGMTLLGTLYCGERHGRWKYAGFSVLPPTNRDEGIKLINEGVRRTENGESAIPLSYDNYMDFAYSQFCRNGESKLAECTIKDIQKALEYTNKAWNLAMEAKEQGDPEAAIAAGDYASIIESLCGALVHRLKSM